jgi:hypothetical protein
MRLILSRKRRSRQRRIEQRVQDVEGYGEQSKSNRREGDKDGVRSAFSIGI